jgi:uncharacterized YccA/Bax inhibitor family protein
VIILHSSNPVFKSIERSEVFASTDAATYRGIFLKTSSMILIAALSGFLAVTYLQEQIFGLVFVSMIIAFIAVIVSMRSVRFARVGAIVYAVAEGVLLGAITWIMNVYYPGIATTALVGTASIFTVMLFLYSSRTIRVTSRMRKVMYSILLAILLFFVSSLILRLFGVTVEIGSSLALGITGLLIVFGALMLILDFDRAESIVSGGYDKSYEWAVAVGLMVTLVWIYIELLRVLAILSSNRS